MSSSNRPDKSSGPGSSDAGYSGERDTSLRRSARLAAKTSVQPDRKSEAAPTSNKSRKPASRTPSNAAKRQKLDVESAYADESPNRTTSSRSRRSGRVASGSETRNKNPPAKRTASSSDEDSEEDDFLEKRKTLEATGKAPTLRKPKGSSPKGKRKGAALHKSDSIEDSLSSSSSASSSSSSEEEKEIPRPRSDHFVGARLLSPKKITTEHSSSDHANEEGETRLLRSRVTSNGTPSSLTQSTTSKKPTPVIPALPVTANKSKDKRSPAKGFSGVPKIKDQDFSGTAISDAASQNQAACMSQNNANKALSNDTDRTNR